MQNVVKSNMKLTKIVPLSYSEQANAKEYSQFK